MVGVLSTWQGVASAGDGQGQRSNAAATVHRGGVITVSAGHRYWRPPSDPPGLPGGHYSVPGKPDPNLPSDCTYQVMSPQAQQVLGPGGATPGVWVTQTCAHPYFINPLQPFWVAHPKTIGPPVNPAALAQQAVAQLPLPSPTVEMAPPAGAQQLVNLATWLWVDPSDWQSFSATVSAGPVSATATATPVKVVWDMGDGSSVTCSGPGTPYTVADANATSDCSYTWHQSSAGQPGGAFQVTATIYFHVTWTAIGAAGGGDLGIVPGPPARVAVQVAESQALNNTPGS